MSNTTKIDFKVQDWELLQEVAKDIGAVCQIGNLKLKLYGSQTYDVQALIKLPGWNFPIGISKDGTLYYDHFGSQSNTMPHLYKLRSEYTLRKAEKEAKKAKKRCRRLKSRERPGWQCVEIFV